MDADNTGTGGKAAVREWPRLLSTQEYEKIHGRRRPAPASRDFFAFGTAWERHDDPEVEQ